MEIKTYVCVVVGAQNQTYNNDAIIQNPQQRGRPVLVRVKPLGFEFGSHAVFENIVERIGADLVVCLT